MWFGVLVRQILGEILRYTGLILISFLVLGVPGMLFRQQMMNHIPFINVVAIVPYLIPDCLRMGIPISMMLATVFVFGRMSGDNEIVALKSMGISPVRLLASILSCSILMSLLCVWMNEISVTWTTKGICNVILNSAEDIVYGRLANEGEIRSDKLFIKVQDVQEDRLIRPEIIIGNVDPHKEITVIAQEARMYANLEKKDLIAELTEGTIQSEVGFAAFRNKQEYRFPIETLLRIDDNNRPTQMSLSRVHERAKELRESIHHIEDSIAAESAMTFLSGEFDQLNSESLRTSRSRLESEKRLLNRTEIEPFRRWSMGFACLCFVLVGAPWAISSRQADIVTNIFICAGPILLLYAAFFSIGLNLAKSCTLPPYGVCLGNVFLLVLGCILIWKSGRE